MYLCLDRETTFIQYPFAAFSSHWELLISWAIGAWISSALPCLLYLVTAFSDILLMQLFHSMRASPKENSSMTLDVNLSTACDTVLILRNDLWPDGFLAWGSFCKWWTSAVKSCLTVLRTFDSGSWKTHLVEFPSFWHQHSGFSCPSRLVAQTPNSVQTLFGTAYMFSFTL